MNNIPNRQNEPHQLERLAAQRMIYASAKRLQLVHFILSVGTVSVLAYVVVLAPNAKVGSTDLKVWSAFWSCTVALLDVFLFSKLIKARKELAARVQEIFDCDILDIKWNRCRAHRKPEPETVAQWANAYQSTYKDTGLQKLKNWYATSVGEFGLPLARLVCQRSNLAWEGDQRRAYAYWAGLLLAALLGPLFGLATAQKWTVQDLVFKFLTPSLPISLFLIKQIRENHEHADVMDSLMDDVQGIWDEAMECRLTPEQLGVESRHLQDQIFEKRRSGPLVSEWAFNRLRSKNEAKMYKGAEALAREARERLKDCPELME